MPSNSNSEPSSPPSLSFIGIIDFSYEAHWLYATESISDLLGYEPSEIIGTSSMELTHPDEFDQIAAMHYETIRQDKAACVAYLRLKHKDPHKGYILCAVARTVVHDVLFGSVSNAVETSKALHNVSTANEITVITPSARHLEFRRWGDPSPMPPSEIPENLRTPPTNPSTNPSTAANTAPGSPKLSPQEDEDAEHESEKKTNSPPTRQLHIDAPLTPQSPRTALILDRFSNRLGILYISNNHVLTPVATPGRSFYDFVAPRDEELVRGWIDVVKSWGVNESGAPSDSGFGFGKFMALPKGREPAATPIDTPPPNNPRLSARHSQPGTSGGGASGSSRRREKSRDKSRSKKDPADEIRVEAIFSAHSDGMMVILRRA